VGKGQMLVKLVGLRSGGQTSFQVLQQVGGDVILLKAIEDDAVKPVQVVKEIGRLADVQGERQGNDSTPPPGRMGPEVQRGFAIEIEAQIEERQRLLIGDGGFFALDER